VAGKGGNQHAGIGKTLKEGLQLENDPIAKKTDGWEKKEPRGCTGKNWMRGRGQREKRRVKKGRVFGERAPYQPHWTAPRRGGRGWVREKKRPSMTAVPHGKIPSDEEKTGNKKKQGDLPERAPETSGIRGKKGAAREGTARSVTRGCQEKRVIAHRRLKVGES